MAFAGSLPISERTFQGSKSLALSTAFAFAHATASSSPGFTGPVSTNW